MKLPLRFADLGPPTSGGGHLAAPVWRKSVEFQVIHGTAMDHELGYAGLTSMQQMLHCNSLALGSRRRGPGIANVSMRSSLCQLFSKTSLNPHPTGEDRERDPGFHSVTTP